MANRKSNSEPNFASALKALLLCAFFVTSGVGYVWYKSQIKVLGDEIGKLEMRLADLQRGNKSRQDQLAERSSPGELDARAKKMNLGVGIPSVSQVVHLTAPAPAPGFSSAHTRSSNEGRVQGVDGEE